jgi:hypothetical protein
MAIVHSVHMTQPDIDRERSLDIDQEREPRAFSFPSRSRLNGQGSLRALLLERTEPDVNAAGVMGAWRPSDRSEP